MTYADQTAGQRVEPGTGLPWECGGGPANDSRYHTVVGAHGLICELYDGSDEQREAYARFIVHTANLHHEMLRLLEDIEESLTADNTYRLLREAIRQTVAKAKGGAA